MFLVGTGKSDQNVFIESFNRNFRDEFLSEHLLTNLGHAKVAIEAWRQEGKQERRKSQLGR